MQYLKVLHLRFLRVIALLLQPDEEATKIITTEFCGQSCIWREKGKREKNKKCQVAACYSHKCCPRKEETFLVEHNWLVKILSKSNKRRQIIKILDFVFGVTWYVIYFRNQIRKFGRKMQLIHAEYRRPVYDLHLVRTCVTFCFVCLSPLWI